VAAKDPVTLKPEYIQPAASNVWCGRVDNNTQTTRIYSYIDQTIFF